MTVQYVHTHVDLLDFRSVFRGKWWCESVGGPIRHTGGAEWDAIEDEISRLEDASSKQRPRGHSKGRVRRGRAALSIKCRLAAAGDEFVEGKRQGPRQ